MASKLASMGLRLAGRRSSFAQPLVGGVVVPGDDRNVLTTPTRGIVSQPHLLPCLPSKAAVTYGGRYTVTLIPGDGIGPEMADNIKYLFRLAGVPVDFETVNIDSTQDVTAAVTAVRRNGVALKGNMSTHVDMSHDRQSKNVELRTRLDLFAALVHGKSVPGLQARHQNLDIVVIRENTEGEYSGIEHECVPGVIESLKVITRENSMRIAEFAFEFAHLNCRKKVTAVHKANIMKLGDGLFLDCCREVSKRYPQLEFEGMIVDNTSMQLVSNPNQFDVLVCPNLYGNIVSNIVCGLTGGSGLSPGINLGSRYAVFEQATRNTGVSMVGQDVANPVAMIRASTAMLNYLGLGYHADLIDSCINETIQSGIRTRDLFGSASTSEFLHAVSCLLQDRSAVAL